MVCTAKYRNALDTCNNRHKSPKSRNSFRMYRSNSLGRPIKALLLFTHDDESFNCNMDMDVWVCTRPEYIDVPGKMWMINVRCCSVVVVVVLESCCSNSNKVLLCRYKRWLDNKKGESEREREKARKRKKRTSVGKK